jgi:hypothetical protein
MVLYTPSSTTGIDLMTAFPASSTTPGSPIPMSVTAFAPGRPPDPYTSSGSR